MGERYWAVIVGARAPKVSPRGVLVEAVRVEGLDGGAETLPLLGLDLTSMRLSEGDLLRVDYQGPRAINGDEHVRRQGGPPLRSPTSCPACEAPLVARRRLGNDTGGLVCPNDRYCGEQVVPRLAHTLGALLDSQRAVNIRTLVRALLDSGRLQNEEGIFSLTADDVKVALQSGGTEDPAPGQWVRLHKDIENARSASAGRILHALLRFHVVIDPDWVAWRLVTRFGSFAKILDARVDEVSAALASGIGSELMDGRKISRQAQQAHQCLQSPWRRDLLDRWQRDGVKAIGTTYHAPPQSLRRTSVGVVVEDARLAPGVADLINQHGGRIRRWRLEEVAKGSLKADLVLDWEMRGLLPQDFGGREPLGVDDFMLAIQEWAEVEDFAVDLMWREVLASHPLRLPIGPDIDEALANPAALRQGVLYLYTRASQQIVLVEASSLKDAFRALGVEPRSLISREEFAVWVTGATEEIRRTSPVLTAPRKAFRPGHPIVVRAQADWAAVPRVAGVYRVYLRDHTCTRVHIGRSHNFEDQSRWHDETEGLHWSNGDDPGVIRLELIPVMSQRVAQDWVTVDLDDAEAQYIRRARSRYQDSHAADVPGAPEVSSGLPGRPPSRVLVWRASGAEE